MRCGALAPRDDRGLPGVQPGQEPFPPSTQHQARHSCSALLAQPGQELCWSPPTLRSSPYPEPSSFLAGGRKLGRGGEKGWGASAGVQVVGEGPHCRADHQQGELWKQTHPTAFCSSAGHIPPSESLAEPLQNAFPVAKHILRAENPGTGSTPPCSIEIYVFR